LPGIEALEGKITKSINFIFENILSHKNTKRIHKIPALPDLFLGNNRE
jgi:hypothetical protein